MSNFKCPTCGITNIDCGKAGYKTDREIELEKKLDIALEALKQYANEDNWCDCTAGFNSEPVDCGCYGCYGFQEAQEAITEIKEIK